MLKAPRAESAAPYPLFFCSLASPGGLPLQLLLLTEKVIENTSMGLPIFGRDCILWCGLEFLGSGLQGSFLVVPCNFQALQATVHLEKLHLRRSLAERSL